MLMISEQGLTGMRGGSRFKYLTTTITLNVSKAMFAMVGLPEPFGRQKQELFDRVPLSFHKQRKYERTDTSR